MEKKYYIIVNPKAYNAFLGVEERSDGVVPNNGIKITKEKFDEFLKTFLNKPGLYKYENGELVANDYEIEIQKKSVLKRRKEILLNNILELTSKKIAMEYHKYDTSEIDVEIDTLKKQYENFDKENE